MNSRLLWMIVSLQLDIQQIVARRVKVNASIEAEEASLNDGSETGGGFADSVKKQEEYEEASLNDTSQTGGGCCFNSGHATAVCSDFSKKSCDNCQQRAECQKAWSCAWMTWEMDGNRDVTNYPTPICKDKPTGERKDHGKKIFNFPWGCHLTDGSCIGTPKKNRNGPEGKDTAEKGGGCCFDSGHATAVCSDLSEKQCSYCVERTQCQKAWSCGWMSWESNEKKEIIPHDPPTCRPFPHVKTGTLSRRNFAWGCHLKDGSCAGTSKRKRKGPPAGSLLQTDALPEAEEADMDPSAFAEIEDTEASLNDASETGGGFSDSVKKQEKSQAAHSRRSS